MALERAVVSGINRAVGLVWVQIPGRMQQTPAYFLGDPPCPRSIVVLDQTTNGAWYVVGMEGPRRRVLNEDFGQAFNYAFGTLIDAVWCDSPWLKRSSLASGTTVGSTLVTGTGDAQRVGTAFIATDANSGRWCSVVHAWDATSSSWPESGGSLWMHTTFMVDGINNCVYQVGFGDWNIAQVWGIPTSGFRSCVVKHDTNFVGAPNTWFLEATIDGNQTQADTGIPVVAQQFYSMDLVVTPGQWAGLWIDGQPGVFTNANIPAYNDQLSPFFGTLNRANVIQYVNIDCFYVDWIGSVIPPII
jgi:hypothetical protein